MNTEKLSGWFLGASFGEKTKGIPPSQPRPLRTLMGASAPLPPACPTLVEALVSPSVPMDPSLPSWALWNPQRVEKVKIYYREKKLLSAETRGGEHGGGGAGCKIKSMHAEVFQIHALWIWIRNKISPTPMPTNPFSLPTSRGGGKGSKTWLTFALK